MYTHAYSVVCVHVSMKKGGVSLVAACKIVSLSMFWSGYSDLQDKDEAYKYKHLSLSSLASIKCCHWNCQLVPQVFGC